MAALPKVLMMLPVSINNSLIWWTFLLFLKVLNLLNVKRRTHSSSARIHLTAYQTIEYKKSMMFAIISVRKGLRPCPHVSKYFLIHSLAEITMYVKQKKQKTENNVTPNKD